MCTDDALINILDHHYFQAINDTATVCTKTVLICILDHDYLQAIDDIAAVCTEAEVSMPVAALSWVLQQPAVCSPIVGASSPKQVEDNVKVITLQQVSIPSHLPYKIR